MNKLAKQLEQALDKNGWSVQTVEQILTERGFPTESAGAIIRELHNSSV